MIKITNLNFQNQTIENIEVDGEDIHDVELKLTKTYLTYGVIRSSELINCLITDNDCDDNTNYINVTKNKSLSTTIKMTEKVKKLLISMTTNY